MQGFAATIIVLTGGGRECGAWPGPAHGGDSGGGGAARQLAAGGRSARELDLPDRFSVGHIVDSEHANGALTIAPVGHSLGWRESVGRVARTRQVVAQKSSSRLVLAWA